MNKYLLLCLILIGCDDKPHEPYVPKYTEAQKQVMDSNVELKAFIESCMSTEYTFFTTCLERYYSMKNTTCNQPTESGSIGKTAVGTAIGVGAAKVLFGK